MHRQENRQGTVWLLAGTGDGPRLAAVLISQGFRVHVSVVGASAADPYRGMDVEGIHVGALAGSQAISAMAADDFCGLGCGCHSPVCAEDQ